MVREHCVLVIEHNTDVGLLVRDALAGAGYRVAVVTDYATAAAALAAVRFEVVLLDTPGAPLSADHWAAMARLRALAGDTPTFLFTAHHPSAVVGHAAHGFRGVIHKPFELEALLAAVNARPDGPAHGPGLATFANRRQTLAPVRQECREIVVDEPSSQASHRRPSSTRSRARGAS